MYSSVAEESIFVTMFSLKEENLVGGYLHGMRGGGKVFQGVAMGFLRDRRGSRCP